MINFQNTKFIIHFLKKASQNQNLQSQNNLIRDIEEKNLKLQDKIDEMEVSC